MPSFIVLAQKQHCFTKGKAKKCSAEIGLNVIFLFCSNLMPNMVMSLNSNSLFKICNHNQIPHSIFGKLAIFGAGIAFIPKVMTS